MSDEIVADMLNREKADLAAGISRIYLADSRSSRNCVMGYTQSGDLIGKFETEEIAIKAGSKLVVTENPDSWDR